MIAPNACGGKGFARVVIAAAIFDSTRTEHPLPSRRSRVR
jgi:hypothetical protein